MDEREATRDSKGYRDGEIKPVILKVFLTIFLCIRKRGKRLVSDHSLIRFTAIPQDFLKKEKSWLELYFNPCHSVGV